VREAPAEALVVSDGFSCREQILQATGRRPVHLAEVLALAAHRREVDGDVARSLRRLTPAGLRRPFRTQLAAVAAGVVGRGGNQ
jgi:hypothetical protein